LFGPVRGGLAYAVIFVGALLAATTGVVAASVISMGLISLPIMLRYGYDSASSPPASSPHPARWRRSFRRRWC
jgi:TRAP-type mannitol/chloroaromatic compound transport system permease large subunit